MSKDDPVADAVDVVFISETVTTAFGGEARLTRHFDPQGVCGDVHAALTGFGCDNGGRTITVHQRGEQGLVLDEAAAAKLRDRLDFTLATIAAMTDFREEPDDDR